jgi:hypothetical protein
MRPDRPWGLGNLFYIGNGAVSQGQSGQGVALTTHPHLVSSYEWEELWLYSYSFLLAYFSAQFSILQAAGGSLCKYLLTSALITLIIIISR